MANFWEGLRLVNAPEGFETFLHSGFPVLLREENHTPAEMLALPEHIFGLG